MIIRLMLQCNRIGNDRRKTMKFRLARISPDRQRLARRATIRELPTRIRPKARRFIRISGDST
jgi:hypothetical protein